MDRKRKSWFRLNGISWNCDASAGIRWNPRHLRYMELSGGRRQSTEIQFQPWSSIISSFELRRTPFATKTGRGRIFYFQTSSEPNGWPGKSKKWSCCNGSSKLKSIFFLRWKNNCTASKQTSILLDCSLLASKFLSQLAEDDCSGIHSPPRKQGLKKAPFIRPHTILTILMIRQLKHQSTHRQSS